MSATDLDQICIQVQLSRAPGLDAARLGAVSETIARRTGGCRGFEMAQGDDDGAYLNLLFATESLRETWHGLREELLGSDEFGEALRTACICVCTGSEGWDDYLLLHHFDPDEPLVDLADH
ncbi:hypothetical protein [Roseateles sp. LYH14W]|uniref:ABM domain-containing protein n=1 Tax=Pelomonas parva TaxID=3299032 RepID=A0ABW7F132_9BURK